MGHGPRLAHRAGGSSTAASPTPWPRSKVSIALGAVAALARNEPVWIGSPVVGAGGIVLAAFALLG
jgi:hypothetical protein